MKTNEKHVILPTKIHCITDKKNHVHVFSENELNKNKLKINK